MDRKCRSENRVLVVENQTLEHLSFSPTRKKIPFQKNIPLLLGPDPFPQINKKRAGNER